MSGARPVLASFARPDAQLRIRALLERGLQKPGDMETQLGDHVGQLGLANLAAAVDRKRMPQNATTPFVPQSNETREQESNS